MFIYLIANHITGKYYIGQHKGRDLRKYLHKKFWEAEHGLGGSSHLYAAIRKYGRSSFSIHALRSDIQTKEELDQVEKDFIIFLKAQDPEYGYNIRRGGEGFTSEEAKEIAKNRLADPTFITRLTMALKEAWKDPETQAKHSESIKKLWQDSEFRDKVVKKLRSPEVRDRKSKANRKRFSTYEARTKQAKAVNAGWSDLELRTRQSELVKKLWSDPQTRYKMMEGVKKRAATISLNGKKTMSKPGHLSYMTKKGHCQRWNINRGKPCTCGYHPLLMLKVNERTT
jgi:hypothetical protein